MDPLTALTIAATAFQLLTFSLTTISRVKSLRDSTTGLVAAHADLEARARTLRHLAASLQQPSRCDVPAAHVAPALAEALHLNERRLRDVAARCMGAAGKLEDVLEQLKVRRGGVGEAFIKVVRGLREKKRVERLERELGECRALLDSTALVGLRDNLDVVSSQVGAGFTAVDAKLKTFVEYVVALHARQLQNTRQGFAGVADQLQAQQSALSTEIQEQHATTNLHLDAALGQLQVSSAAKERIDTLKDEIHFAEHRSRFKNISPAHRDTFQWLFAATHTKTRGKKAAEHEPAWASMVDFLQGPGKMYWIHGKPGSGKSTLMSYIATCDRTKELLQAWAGGDARGVLQIFFFFWRYGSSLQKSQEGLLRSLLFQLMQHEAASAEAIAACADRHGSTFGQLQSLREALLEGLAASSRKLFVQFDGLDEFAGFAGELVDLCRGLQRLDNVKLCVASRPEAVFVKGFEHVPQLRLQDLTRGDMENYTREQLKDMAEGPQLAGIIAEKAQGVFLWATLVTRSILNGFYKDETPDALMARLQRLPSELKALYGEVLSNIEEEHREVVYLCLRLLLAWTELKDKNWSHSRFTKSPSLFLLLLHQKPKMPVYAPTEELSVERLVQACQQYGRQVSLQSLGLLEIHSFGKTCNCATRCLDVDDCDVLLHEEVQSGDMSPLDQLKVQQQCAVDVMHRSVLDFLVDDFNTKSHVGHVIPANEANQDANWLEKELKQLAWSLYRWLTLFPRCHIDDPFRCISSSDYLLHTIFSAVQSIEYQGGNADDVLAALEELAIRTNATTKLFQKGHSRRVRFSFSESEDQHVQFLRWCCRYKLTGYVLPRLQALEQKGELESVSLALSGIVDVYSTTGFEHSIVFYSEVLAAQFCCLQDLGGRKVLSLAKSRLVESGLRQLEPVVQDASLESACLLPEILWRVADNAMKLFPRMDGLSTSGSQVRDPATFARRMERFRVQCKEALHGGVSYHYRISCAGVRVSGGRRYDTVTVHIDEDLIMEGWINLLHVEMGQRQRAASPQRETYPARVILDIRAEGATAAEEMYFCISEEELMRFLCLTRRQTGAGGTAPRHLTYLWSLLETQCHAAEGTLARCKMLFWGSRTAQGVNKPFVSSAQYWPGLEKTGLWRQHGKDHALQRCQCMDGAGGGGSIDGGSTE